MPLRLLIGSALLLASCAASALEIENRSEATKTSACEIELAWPQVGVAAIDRELGAWIEAQAADFRRQAEAERDAGESTWTLDIGYEVARNDAAMLGLIFRVESYTGGAHGNLAIVTHNFRLPGGNDLALAEVLDGERGLARLSALAIADLERRLTAADATSDRDWIRRGAGPEWDNFAAFVLLPKALRVEFQPYQVGPWVIGPQSVTIPLAELSTALRGESSAVTPSFDCAAAANPNERSICAEPVLAELDRELAMAFARRLRVASDRGALRAAQRVWLQRRDAACADQVGPLLSACLIGIYRLRVAEFAAAR